MTCRVVHISWSQTSGVRRVNIMRPGQWGNPFPIGRYTRKEALTLYRAWLRKQIAKKFITLEQLRNLDGCELACVCKPYHKCHGDILAKAVAWAVGKGSM